MLALVKAARAWCGSSLSSRFLPQWRVHYLLLAPRARGNSVQQRPSWWPAGSPEGEPVMWHLGDSKVTVWHIFTDVSNFSVILFSCLPFKLQSELVTQETWPPHLLIYTLLNRYWADFHSRANCLQPATGRVVECFETLGKEDWGGLTFSEKI